MKRVQLYLHAENIPEIKRVEVSEILNQAELLQTLTEAFPSQANGSDVFCFIEDEETDLKGKFDKVKPKMHIHCHRCQKVAVSVIYNGQTRIINIPPSTTAAKLLKKVTKEFGISEVDAANLVLKLADRSTLETTSHIGSFVSFPACSINLYLTPNQQVQG